MIIHIKTNKNIIWQIAVILLAVEFLGPNANLCILAVFVLFFLVWNNWRIPLNFPGSIFYIVMLLMSAVIGMHNNIYIFFKQLAYNMAPILYWILAYYIYKRYQGPEISQKIINTIYITSAIYTVWDIIRIPILMRHSFSGINAFRGLIGDGSMLTVLGIYLYLVYRDQLWPKKCLTTVIGLLSMISLVMHFSRANILSLLILLLLSGKLKKIRNIIEYAIIIACTIWVGNKLLPEVASQFLNKISNTLNEIRPNSNTWSHVTIVHNWRGYEIYCAQKQFLRSNLFNQIFGSGFGTQLDVQGNAYLVSSENELSFLHNGYYTQLLISGIAGLGIFIGWMISLYRLGFKVKSMREGSFIKGLTFILIITTYVIMGPLYSFSESTLVFYIALMYFIGEPKNTVRYKRNINNMII